jgi:hypothetical protein
VSLPLRITTLFVAFVLVVAGVAFLFIRYLLGTAPPTVDFAAGHAAGQPVDMTIMTDPVNDVTQTPDWVSYFVRSPQTDRWVHSTIWQLPAATRINVTAYEFDTCDPLRNNEWGRVSGTVGNTMTVSGEADGPDGVVSVVNSDADCSVAHTFTVPGLNINVPFEGVLYTAKNQCTQAPCAMSDTHVVTHFSFVTPGTAAEYNWQCFIPCGLASLDGNGHAMGTLGFMSGFLKIVKTA